MEAYTPDKSVPQEVTALLSGARVILRETRRAVTPFGGAAVVIAYLRKIGLVEQVRRHLPIQWNSPNRIEPTATWMAFLTAVPAGAKRFAHAGMLRGDRALDALPGMNRFPTDDTIRNLFRSFGMGEIRRFFEPMTEWTMQRLPLRPEGYTLDMDSTVLERYGQQEGSLKGHHPRRHGRPSHHPLLAVLSEAHLLLHGRLRGGGPKGHPRLRLWRGGVSRRSSRAVEIAPENSSAESRLRLLRRPIAGLSGTAQPARHCSRQADQVGEAGGTRVCDVEVDALPEWPGSSGI